MFAKNEENDKKSTSVLKKRKCIIEDVILKNNVKAEPLFVTFANGRPQESASLKGTLHWNTSHDRRRRHRRMFTVETPRLNYVGKNFGNETGTSFTNHTQFLGILDKATGKMRLMETSSFCAHPMLETASTTNYLFAKPHQSFTYDEKEEVITSAFGSKRAKQLVSHHKQYQVDAQNMSKAVNQAAESVSVKASELIDDSQEEESLVAILPECNREAGCPEDVYKLESIAPDSLLVYFEEFARNLLLEGKNHNPKWTSLCRELLARAKLEKDDENQVRLTCVALYVEYLLSFLRMKSRDLRYFRFNDNNMKGCPPKIKNHIMNEYTQHNHNQRFRTRQNEDSAFCCVLVMSLIANKYCLPVNTLLLSLGIPRDKLNLLMKVIGATYVAKSHSYELKIPLTKLRKPHKRRGYQKKMRL
ncbi:DNA-directed RNA polymerase I subunit RPA49 isoform X1 [Panulirus ornatus]|uniref:DNA-directed RNA polymerase I subunit RPA49 isoform X1 n=1 Tax=Panulirus ornatus TaxID=150431 RepID=UPI003A8901F3